MRLRYDIVDVFTDRPFAGNQLAVVHGAEQLSTAQCHEIAREFNFSETTFPAPTSSDEYASRIFTPGGEIPFAGHPTLGTAWVLREQGVLTADRVTQVCGAGRIAVGFDGDTVALSAVPRDVVGPLDDAVVAALLADLGLADSDLDGPAWVAGCGLSFVHLPVVADAVARVRSGGLRPVREYAGMPTGTRDPLEGVNLVAVTGQAPDLAVHARVFVPGLAVDEDPATGSAAAGLGVALVAAGQLPEGGSYTIDQGIEMGRPSVLFGRVEAADGAATLCHVAGHVQPVASGEIAVPALS